MVDGAEASLAYGSRAGWDASASVGGEIGAGQVAIDGRYSRGDGFIPVVEGQRGGADRAAPYEQGGLGLRLRFDAGDNGRIEASVRGFSDRRDRGVHFTKSKTDGVEASLRLVHDPAGPTQWLALGHLPVTDFHASFSQIAGKGRSAGR